MYPYPILFDMDLYSILMAVGFLCGMIYFRVFCDRFGIEAKVQNFVILSGVVILVGGYFAAVLTQALYNGLADGVFEITENTGATFYGGFIGGMLVFFLLYFLPGRYIFHIDTKKNIFPLFEIGSGAIAIGHGIGRIGCLCAGCCHGKPTDAWYGIYNVWLGCKTVPVQLMEAIFLFLLAGWMTTRLLRKRTGNMSVYLSGYAVWRFVAEYLRTDDRGATFVSFLSPSQLVAILLFVIGIGLFVFQKKWEKKHPDSGEAPV